MSRGWTYNPGEHNAICDSCGRKFKSSQLKKRWDGLMVCEEDWNPRQTLDFVRAHTDHQVPPWSRPAGTVTFVPMNYDYRLSDRTNISESVITNATFQRSLSDSVTLSDMIGVNESKGFPEPVTLSENLSTISSVDRTFTETLAVSDILAITINVGNEINGAEINAYSIG